MHAQTFSIIVCIIVWEAAERSIAVASTYTFRMGSGRGHKFGIFFVQVINVPCSGNPGATPAAPTPPPADLPPATTPPAGGDGIIWGAYAGSGGAVGGPGPAYATYHYYGG